MTVYSHSNAMFADCQAFFQFFGENAKIQGSQEVLYGGVGSFSLFEVLLSPDGECGSCQQDQAEDKLQAV